MFAEDAIGMSVDKVNREIVAKAELEMIAGVEKQTAVLEVHQFRLYEVMDSPRCLTAKSSLAQA
jgi:hypothetical protein